MSKIKQLAAAALSLALIAGCTSGTTSSSSQGSTAAGSSNPTASTAQGSSTAAPSAGGEVEVSAPNEFPIVKEKVTLDFLVQSNVGVEDFATNTFSQWYEDKTNVHVNFKLIPAKDGDQKLNLILASGDYPDVYMNCPFTMTQIMSYGSQGIFYPLNDLIEKQGYHMVNDIFNGETTDFVKGMITFPDGNIYSIPEINQCYHCSMAQKMWVYMPWVKKLNLEVPTTTDDFYNMLKAFKEQDPNGNGIADEIPLAGATDGWFANISGFIMNAFIYTESTSEDLIGEVFLKDGVVTVPFDKPEWKEGLQYLHKLYADGLLSPETFTQDGDQLRQMGENPDIPILGAAPGGHSGVMCQFYGDSGRWLEFESIAPLQGPNGLRTCYYDPFGISVGEFIVSSTCKYPEVAVKWADGLFDMETTLRSVFGVLDEHWRWSNDGEIGLNGKPALYTTLIPWSEGVQNFCWQQTGPTLRTPDVRLGQTQDPDDPLEYKLYTETHDRYEPYRPESSEVMPPLPFTTEEATELADLQKTIYDYVGEMFARFVIGEVDIDSGWDAYVGEINNMNLARYLEVYQQAYDSIYKK